MGKVISGIFGSNNETKAAAPQVNAQAYNYGGREGFAEEQRKRFEAMGQGAQGRQADQAGYEVARNDYNRAQVARQGQAQAANLMMNRATGATPSIARMAANRQMGQAAAEQASAAASARGPAALALAQQGAANNVANAQSSIAGQAQINEAQERLAAEQAAFGAQTGMRGQDYQSMAQESANDQFNAQMRAGQRAQNDAFQMGMVGNELAVGNAQMTGQMNQQAQQSGNQLGAAGINAQVGEGNAGRAQQNAMGVMGMASSTAGAVAGAMSDARAKTNVRPVGYRADGGPVAQGQPYVVGERGPEVIVPQQSGVVIPNEIASQIAPSTWGTGGPDLQGQAIRRMSAENASNNVHAAIQQAEAYKDPYQRDVERVQMLRAVTPDLVDAEDERQERVGIARMGLTRKAQAKEKSKAPAKSGPKKDAPPSTGERVGGALSGIGGAFERMSSSVPVAHISQGNYAPSLLALPGRADGGPVAGGSPYMVGERGPEIVLPGRQGSNMLAAQTAYTGTFGGGAEATKGGGMNTQAGLQWNNSELAGMFGRGRGMTGGAMAGPGRGMMMSDRRAKAAAWDEGHAAAIADVEKLARKSPEELAAMSEGEGYVPAAAAVRFAKAGAYDEGKQGAAAQAAEVEKRRQAQAYIDAEKEKARLSARRLGVAHSIERTNPADEARAVAPQPIAMRAGGGPVAKGAPYVVGERGPEVVVPETIDLDEVDPGRTIDLDKPAFDQRDVSAGLWFRRGTKGEQRADLRRFQDKAGSEADAMMAGMKKSLGEGPSVSKALARANRSMEGSEYAYKPEYTPPDQAPGEKNVGPMAQNMAADPVAGTAVKKDPKTGMLMLDRDKLLKLNSASVASLQKQIDQLKKGGISRMKKSPSKEPKS